MKKIKIIYVMIILLVFYTNLIYAVSNNLYNIELMDGISEIGQGYFSDSEGNTLNINIKELSSTEGIEYNDKSLEIIISEANKLSIDSLKDELEEQLKEKFGNSLSDEYMQQYLDNIRFDGIIEKRVDKLNIYTCFYYRTKWSVGEDYSYFTDTYQVISGKTLYTINVSGTKKFIESEKVNNMLDTFYIVNFKQIEKANIIDDMLSAGFSGMLEALIIMLIFGGFGAIFGRKKKHKESASSINENTYVKQFNSTYSDDVNFIKAEKESSLNKENSIQNVPQQYCNQCGTKVEINWEFCNNCGEKIIK